MEFFADDYVVSTPEALELVYARLALLRAGELLPLFSPGFVTTQFQHCPYGIAHYLLPYCTDAEAVIREALERVLAEQSPLFSPNWSLSYVLAHATLTLDLVKDIPLDRFLAVKGFSLRGAAEMLETALPDLSAWEAFWSLSDSWSGTLGALLDAASTFSGSAISSSAPLPLAPPLPAIPPSPPFYQGGSLVAWQLLSADRVLSPALAEGLWLVSVTSRDPVFFGLLVSSCFQPSPRLVAAARGFTPAHLRALFMERWSTLEDARSLWVSSRSKWLEQSRTLRRELALVPEQSFAS